MSYRRETLSDQIVEVTSMSVVTVIAFDNLAANSHHDGAGLPHCTGHRQAAENQR
jgi:hypothetical protein